ncbi:MAG: exodeoxyribonuclease V subunit gamma [Neisseria sp.]|nr:exodeoxyribonuclease V subunit gamma [Neisseria sp.]
MLYLYQSDRLENLVAMLQMVQNNKPASQTFMQNHYIVQSQGMRRFLNRELAKATGISANNKFSLPAGFTWHLMRQVNPQLPELSPFSPQVMQWRLLKLFTQADFAQHTPLAAQALQAYLSLGESAAYDLSGQIADIFDQYLVYRETWIQAWQAGKTLNLGDDELWQAELWRYLSQGNQAKLHRVAMWQDLLNRVSAQHLPENLYVFGVSALAPMYVQLLEKISEFCDVHIFALNPCQESWGDLRTPQANDATLFDSEDERTHPLLASWGKQGRDFFASLPELKIQHEFEPYNDLPSANLLQHLQADIQTLNQSQNCQLDDSIVINSAHSPLRELQILKDHLLKTLSDNPDLQPHEIAVLTPNIEPYTPFIHAVFGQEHAHSPNLPYSISDVRLNAHQPLLQALEHLLMLLNNQRFSLEQVFKLLDYDAVLEKFQLNREDLDLLRDTCEKLNIRWGLDQNMRGENDLFTWQQGLNRLSLGFMLPETEDNHLWHGMSPWFADTNHLPILSAFIRFIQTLSSVHQNWQTSASVQEWLERIHYLLEHMFAADEADQSALQSLEQSLSRWLEETQLAEFNGLLSPNILNRHLLNFLSSQSEAGFLRKGITFCSMVPMRSLPFKVLCLLGLNDDNFPRQTKASSFDLIAKHPKAGDRARRDDDRYLFLEAIISARQQLYLSYVGREVKDNSELAPSTLIGELINCVANMVNQSSDELSEKWVTQHPLQAFSRQYFQNAGERTPKLFSYRSDFANALNLEKQEIMPFLEPMPSANGSSQAIIEQQDFLNYWRNPIRAWLKHTLSWKSQFIEEAPEFNEPFTATDPQLLKLEYLKHTRQQHQIQTLKQQLQAQSALPEQEFGEQVWQETEELFQTIDTEILHSPKMPNFAYQLTLGEHTLSGNLENLYQAGHIFFLFKKANAPDKIKCTLEHLIANANGLNINSYLIDEKGKIATWNKIDGQAAQACLAQWLTWYQCRHEQFLYFQPKTTLEAAKIVQNPPKPEKNETEVSPEKIIQKILDEAQKAWEEVQDYDENKVIFEHAKESLVEHPNFMELAQLLGETLKLVDFQDIK